VSYLGFHALFILPPLVLLGWSQRGRLDRIHPAAGRFLLAIAAIAFVYTTPWDNYLVARGVWGYGEDRVIGTIGYVPIEEYLFFVLQPLLAGLWLYSLLPTSTRPVGAASRWAGAAVYAAFAALGVALLAGGERGTYLGLILVWAAPVLCFQWLYAGCEIWARRRTWAVGVAVPTGYLWVADATAIDLGVWQISASHTLGLSVGPLPLEEAVFFLVTNLLVVQGLLLFLYSPIARSVGGASAALPAAPRGLVSSAVSPRAARGPDSAP
jgi:lycopene cyclase domain-containing protein